MQTQQIVAAIQAGDLGRAEQLSRTALDASPSDENLLLLLAISLHMQGRPQDAAPVYAELTRVQPLSSEYWNNYATALVGSGDLKAAADAYAKALDLDPANATARSQLGATLIQMHEYLAARDLLLDAVEKQPESLRARVEAARACCRCQDYEGATDLLRHWRLSVPVNDDALQLELAEVLTQNNEIPGATELLEDLLARHPDHHEARVQLAHLYERRNRLDAAHAVLAPVMQAGSGSSELQRIRGLHVEATLAMRGKDAAAARDLLVQAGPESDTDYNHYFQLASAYDKLGDTSEAMDALRVAHEREADERRYDSPEFYAPGAPAMPMDAPRVSAEQFARWPKYIAPEMRDSPVFVVGFPRSGTTLLEQMLDAHPALQSMDENPFFNRLAGILGQHDRRILDDLSVLRQFDCDELRKRYNTMVGERIERNWDLRLVDKNPLNMLWLPMMVRLFPESKFILAVRHPCDVILSCYMQNFRASTLAAACSTLERLARAYAETMQRWLDDVQVFKPSVMVSRYEDLVDDFPAQVSRIAAFLELDDVAPMLQFDRHARGKAYIATPSYSQVIEPVNRRGVGRWQRYREYFEPVLPVLEPMLRHWGYAGS
ncbi:tetratricopeptide repeat-containing sulfotransferase family protein [Dyella japonica]|uniref:tetratricopeptide repeat-containing sulfotransferase family protein n=1 Tax=Dyella japonica TaxID=231455 RepID=UPI0002F9D6BB|nr:tetratricopeptide repeat-containing sulfotransferase family protein [Dyella japonica]